jgi:hypothetical protein
MNGLTQEEFKSWVAYFAMPRLSGSNAENDRARVVATAQLRRQVRSLRGCRSRCLRSGEKTDPGFPSRAVGAHQVCVDRAEFEAYRALAAKYMSKPAELQWEE